MKRFILTPRAKKDVNDIWDYIAADNVEAAGRVLDALDNAMVKLAGNPGIGHWREELADKRHRFFLVYSYLIVYRHEAKPLQDYPGAPRGTRRTKHPGTLAGPVSHSYPRLSTHATSPPRPKTGSAERSKPVFGYSSSGPFPKNSASPRLCVENSPTPIENLPRPEVDTPLFNPV
jgi:plasmid stabilization system protein ParE